MEKRNPKKQLVILITGATAGIGRQSALAFARAGHRVFATGRREAALASLREEAAGTALEAIALDVTSAESIANLTREIDARTSGYGVDILVNNAGYGLIGPLETITESDLRAQFETNVFGLMAMTRAFLPQMRARRSGRILNVSSMGGRVTLPFFGAYNATKYAVESLSDALRNEVAGFGVKVVLIEPGAIHTEFSDRAMETVGKYRGADSPYGAVLTRADELRARADSTAVGPEHVVRAIERATYSRWPSARYVVPFRTQIVLALFAWLPTRWMDGILRALFGLNRLGLPARSERGAAAGA